MIIAIILIGALLVYVYQQEQIIISLKGEVEEKNREIRILKRNNNV